jgi:hypothetical protein
MNVQSVNAALQKPKTLTLAQRQAIWAYVFLIVPLLFFLAVRLYPAFESLRLSFLDYQSPLAPSKFVGLKNFSEMTQDAVLGKALMNTLLYTLIGVPAQVILGLGIALLLQSVTKARGLFRAIYFAPFVTPIVASAWVAEPKFWPGQSTPRACWTSGTTVFGFARAGPGERRRVDRLAAIGLSGCDFSGRSRGRAACFFRGGQFGWCQRLAAFSSHHLAVIKSDVGFFGRDWHQRFLATFCADR